MHEDRDLRPSDIQALSNKDGLAAFWGSLGYSIDARLEQTPQAMGITGETLQRQIRHIERIADQENGTLQVYLVELKSVTQANLQGIARAFRNRAGQFLVVLTSDYEDLDFVLLERVLPGAAEQGIGTRQVGIRPRSLTVNRRNPGPVELRVLRRFTFTEGDADAQFDKLLSAYAVAEWAEKFFNNRALFSDYYLNERLRSLPEWSEDPKPAYKRLRELYAGSPAKFTGKPESSLRNELFEPVLTALGFEARPGKSTTSDEVDPDYHLFAPGAKANGKPLAVCLAYVWGRSLDGKDETRDSQTPEENPSFAVVSLLERAEAPWAIVTNGKVWRLYSVKAHSRATNYYEIDLEEALASSDPNEFFRYFWLLFRAAAFVPQPVPGAGLAQRLNFGGELEIRAPEAPVQPEGQAQNLSFLDRLLEDSEAFARRLGDRLKDRVFEEIFPHFAEGFIQEAGGTARLLTLADQQREAELTDCFQATLTFLYRLLFLLYAESRDLLPVRETHGYRAASLTKIKGEVAIAAGTLEDQVRKGLENAYRNDSTALYDRIFELCRVVDKGNQELNVPLYNGGLFLTTVDDEDASEEAKHARFLARHKLPDRFLALGLDLMARDVDEKRGDLVFIDYKSLGVRQLGSIYEGLLEFKLRVATEKMAVIKGKKTEEVVTYAEAKHKKLKVLTKGRGKDAEERTYSKGDVYLENDRRERKATGSYYTPDYIVKYIVESTVGPVLEEKFEALRPRLREAQKRLAKEREKAAALRKALGKSDDPEREAYLKTRALVDELFSVKVLDPAMGSGHFLVETVDFVTDRMLRFLNAFPWNPIQYELSETRRKILDAMEDQGVVIDRGRLTDVNLLKRHVLKRCTYGVDLNPMAVELAKVSLWLDCFTLGAPLSFLDHHLKPGNSLIGATIDESKKAIEGATQLDLFGTRFAGLMSATDLMRRISELSDVTAKQVEESRREYLKASDSLAPFKRMLNVYTSQWFGNEKALDIFRRGHADEWFQKPGAIKSLSSEDRAIIDTTTKGAAEKAFFHWELEFPEVFFGPRAGTTRTVERLEAAGFDAVIGNPPYDVLASEELGYDVSADLEFYESVPTLAPAIRGKKNLYKLFICRGAELMSSSGAFAFIVPMALLGDDQAGGVRRLLLEETCIIAIEAFPQKDDPHNRVFPEAKLATTIFVTHAQSQNRRLTVRTHSGRHIDAESSKVEPTPKQIVAFDPENSPIPTCTQRDWDIAMRIINLHQIKRLGDYCHASQGEVNETTDGKRGFISSNPKDGPPILRGSNICLYALREASQGEAIYLRKQKYLHGKPDSIKARHHEQRRVAWQESSPQNNFRRIIAAPIPKGQFCNHKINYIAESDAKLDVDFILAILNSKASDWFFRLGSSNAAVSHYQIYNLPAPAISQPHVCDTWNALILAGRWAELCSCLGNACTESGGIPRGVAEALAEMSRRIQEIEANRVVKARSERSHLAPESQPIQDAIDTVLFHCYGLNEDDARYVDMRLKQML